MGPEGRAGRAAQAHYSTAGRGGQDVRACENAGGRRERAGPKRRRRKGLRVCTGVRNSVRGACEFRQ